MGLREALHAIGPGQDEESRLARAQAKAAAYVDMLAPRIPLQWTSGDLVVTIRAVELTPPRTGFTVWVNGTLGGRPIPGRLQQLSYANPPAKLGLIASAKQMVEQTLRETMA